MERTGRVQNHLDTRLLDYFVKRTVLCNVADYDDFQLAALVFVGVTYGLRLLLRTDGCDNCVTLAQELV